MTLEYSIGAYESMSNIDGVDAFINEEVPSHEHKMFGRNHTKDYHNILIWAMLWIKKMLKSLLTPMIILSELMYVYLMNKVENDGQSHQVCDRQIG